MCMAKRYSSIKISAKSPADRPIFRSCPSNLLSAVHRFTKEWIKPGARRVNLLSPHELSTEARADGKAGKTARESLELLSQVNFFILIRFRLFFAMFFFLSYPGSVCNCTLVWIIQHYLYRSRSHIETRFTNSRILKLIQAYPIIYREAWRDGESIGDTISISGLNTYMCSRCMSIYMWG